ncbi:YehS family protein [Parasporobacterium paucivorans]
MVRYKKIEMFCNNGSNWKGKEYKLDNNDILIRLRYALDIKDADIVEMFKLGGVDVTKEDVLKMLSKPDEDEDGSEDRLECNYFMLESFLNGFIIFKRGKQEEKADQPAKPVLSIKNSSNVNNILLKKLKIALALSSEDMIEIFELAGITITKGELSAVFRKEGHRNYKECGDRYVRNFLKGLAIKYRK